MSLSADGRVFLPYAERLVRTANEARNVLADQKRYKRRTVRIGSIPIMAPYGITGLLSDFDRDTPGIRLKITEGEPDLLKDQLRKGHLDLAFIRDWNHEVEQGDAEDDFIRIPYDTDQLVAVLPLYEGSEVVLFASDGRALLFPPEVVSLKASRTTQGVAVMALKKKAVVTQAQFAPDTLIRNHARYRARSLPAAGALLREDDRGEEQMSLI